MLSADLALTDTATSLARDIRARRRTSIEAVQSHLDRIAADNARLNAIVVFNAEAALQRAAHADAALDRGEVWGPLHGVPITVKEAFEVRGLPTTVNFKPLRRHVSDEDALVVTRLQEAGAIILGKTNVPMLLAD